MVTTERMIIDNEWRRAFFIGGSWDGASLRFTGHARSELHLLKRPEFRHDPQFQDRVQESVDDWRAEHYRLETEQPEWVVYRLDSTT